MPTQNVNLSTQQAGFIRKSIDQGGFRNASEVVRAGLRLLEHQERQNKIKLTHLKSLIKTGFDEIERGEYKSVTENNIDQFLASLGTAKGKRK